MEKDFCEYCNAVLPEAEKLITVYRHRKGKHFIFEHVPARVCQKCGERYFSSASVGKMESEMKKSKLPANLVPVPVIELQPAG